MKTVAMLTTAALLSLPSLAAASCWQEQHSAQISCADGQTYDQETRSCVSTTS